MLATSVANFRYRKRGLQRTFPVTYRTADIVERNWPNESTFSVDLRNSYFKSCLKSMLYRLLFQLSKSLDTIAALQFYG